MDKTFKESEASMKKSIDSLSAEYKSIRAGRANPAILDRITVDYYGSPSPIAQVASVSITESRVLTIQPWDASILNGIEKAIQKADLGVNPQNDGKVIRVIFPQLTEDRRREISKDISKMAEETKVTIRSIRRDTLDSLKSLKKKSEITEDDLRNGEKKIQNLTDKYCGEIDKMCESKVEQIMEV